MNIKDLKSKIISNPYLRKIYKRLPNNIIEIYIQLNWKPGWRRWKKSDSYKNQLTSLNHLKDKYAGETCIIMGNGPSLKQSNWKLIQNCKTFGLNRIKLLEDEMGFSPSFLVVIKDLVIEQFPSDILNFDGLKFLDYKSSTKNNDLLADKDSFFIAEKISVEGKFESDLLQGWYRGYTVTYAAMQVAYYLGFKKVCLIGVDHNFVTIGNPRENVVSDGDDPNHFHPSYFGKGVKWALPDLEGSERFYKKAKEHYEINNREIVDCTINGKLNIFRKSSLEIELKK
jgi:hypothetical protein